ncbi:MAG: HAD-IA family hydrolase [Acidimicrobiales bacterium]
MELNQYEADHGIPLDFIRQLNAKNTNDNAWARFERREISVEEFDAAFAAESEAAGHRIPGAELIGLLEGEIRPAVVEAVATIKNNGYIVACLTNSTGTDHREEVLAVKAMFDFVIDSNAVGTRKPEPEFFERSCELAGVQPAEVIFLDDLGMNLKPAREMGMTTIKVLDEAQLLRDLGELLDLDLGA